MDESVISRRHRPFLAPVWILALLVLAVAAIALAVYSSVTTTTVVLVRPPIRPSGSIADPPLLPEGEARAQQLAHLIGSGRQGPGRIEAIYVAPARSAQQTAAPVAALTGLTPKVLTQTDVDEGAATVLAESRGQVVMVVAAPDAIPQWVEALSGIRLAAAPPEESASLYVISLPTLGRSRLLQLQY